MRVGVEGVEGLRRGWWMLGEGEDVRGRGWVCRRGLDTEGGIEGGGC